MTMNAVNHVILPDEVKVDHGGVVVSGSAEPGTYLVICNVRQHFLDGLFGFVEVKAKGPNK